MHRKTKAYLSMTAAMITVGSSFVVSKFIVARFPVFLASGLRYGLAAVIFLVILYVKEHGFPKLARQDVLRLFLLAL